MDHVFDSPDISCSDGICCHLFKPVSFFLGFTILAIHFQLLTFKTYLSNFLIFSRSFTDMFCGQFNEIDNTNMCPHGARNNSCNKLACLKGLGDTCDVMGSPILHGDCADGLFCACGQCTGCIKGKCEQNDCLHLWNGLNSMSYKVPAQQLGPGQYRKRLMKRPILRFPFDYAVGEE